MRTSLLVLSLAAACGSSDSGAAPDGAAGDPDAIAPPPSRSALVEIGLVPPEFQGDSPRMSITGGFVNSPDARCRHRETIGSCEVTDCPQALGSDYADPGELTFSPALGGAIRFTPGPSFLFFTANTVPWAADETITLTAAGAEVPAFSGAVASPRTLDAGEGRDPFESPVSKSQPFTARWVPSAENVLVILRQGRDTPQGEFEVLIRCTGSGNSGSLTIPAEALVDLIPKATGGLSLAVNAHALREKVVVAGDYGVRLRALRSFGQTFFHDVQ